MARYDRPQGSYLEAQGCRRCTSVLSLHPPVHPFRSFSVVTPRVSRIWGVYRGRRQEGQQDHRVRGSRLILAVTVRGLGFRFGFVVLLGGRFAGLGACHCNSIVSDDFVTWLSPSSQLVRELNGMGGCMTRAGPTVTGDPEHGADWPGGQSRGGQSKAVRTKRAPSSKRNGGSYRSLK